MMKNLFAIGLIALLLVLSSCTKDTTLSELHNSTAIEDSNFESKLEQTLLGILAQKLDISAFKDIHRSISMTHKTGLDEISYAQELLSATANTFNKAPRPRNLIAQIAPAKDLRSSTNQQAKSKQPLLYFKDGQFIAYRPLSLERLKQEKIQFYWPNHDLWDGTSIPLLAITSAADTIIAYSTEQDAQGNIRLIPHQIQESDALKRPILIIGEEEIPYAYLLDPQTKNLLAVADKQTKKTPTLSLMQQNVQRSIYTVYLGRFKAENLHEPWTRGGPEFIIQFAGTQDFEMKSMADTVRFKNLTSKTRWIFSLKRKEAKKRLWYDFGISKPLLTSWAPELVFGHLLIVEEDPGFKHAFKISLGGSFLGNKFSIEDSFTIKSNDDMIASMSVHKDFLLSAGNGYPTKDWTVYESAGVFFTLPIVKNKVYDYQEIQN